MKPGNRIQAQFGRYTPHLYLVLAALALGLLCGVLAQGTLSAADKLSLATYLKQFVHVEARRPIYQAIFHPALADNLKVIGLLYLLGISVAGMPLVLALVSFRGFILGFSISVLLTLWHWQGAGFALVTMGISNFFILPALAISAAVALGFSWDLVSPQARRSAPHLGQSFAFFTGLVFAMAAVTLVGTVFEAYAIPLLVHLLSPWGM